MMNKRLRLYVAAFLVTLGVFGAQPALVALGLSGLTSTKAIVEPVEGAE